MPLTPAEWGDSLVLWQITAYIVFTLSYIPVWHSRWWEAWGNDWGFRMPKKASSAMRIKLFYPPWWLSGTVWWILYSLAGFSVWNTLRFSGASTTLDAAVIVFLVWMFVQGTWTIPFFYWGMPFWSCTHLLAAALLSTVYAVLGPLASNNNLLSLWLVLPIVIANYAVSLINLYLWAAYTRRFVGNPMVAFLSRDFTPINIDVYMYENFYLGEERKR